MSNESNSNPGVDFDFEDVVEIVPNQKKLTAIQGRKTIYPKKHGACGILTWINNIELEYGEEEPCLFLRRERFGSGYQVGIPLSKMYEFVDDEDRTFRDDGKVMIENCRMYADILFGEGCHIQADVHRILDIILGNIDAVINHMPMPLVTQVDIDNLMDSAGLRFTEGSGDEETVIVDATGDDGSGKIISPGGKLNTGKLLTRSGSWDWEV